MKPAAAPLVGVSDQESNPIAAHHKRRLAPGSSPRPKIQEIRP